MPNAMTRRYCNDLANEAQRFADALDRYTVAARKAQRLADAPDADSKVVSAALSDAQRARAAFRQMIIDSKPGGP